MAKPVRETTQWNIHADADLVFAMNSKTTGEPVAVFVQNPNGSYGWSLSLKHLDKAKGDYETVANIYSQITGLRHEVCYGMLFEGKVGSIDDYRR